MTSIVSFAEAQAAEEARTSPPKEEVCLLADAEDEAEEVQEAEEERDGEEDMVHALLALSQGRQAPTPAPRRAKRPSSSTAAGPLKRRGVADRASQFTCKHPGCGKVYNSSDGVRKHCRVVHRDWLSSLSGYGPETYCSWEECL